MASIIFFVLPPSYVIFKASITLEKGSPLPPTNTAYYLLLFLVSVIVLAAKNCRAFDNVSVMVSGTSFPSVIQNTSIALE